MKYRIAKVIHATQVVQVDLIFYVQRPDNHSRISKALQEDIEHLKDYHAFALVGGGFESEPRMLIGFSTMEENRAQVVNDMLSETEHLAYLSVGFLEPFIKE